MQFRIDAIGTEIILKLNNDDLITCKIIAVNGYGYIVEHEGKSGFLYEIDGEGCFLEMFQPALHAHPDISAVREI
jgi:hypothetical protein